jgi:hypothetical protein
LGQMARLFDHLVGAGEQRSRHFENPAGAALRGVRLPALQPPGRVSFRGIPAPAG